MYNFLNFIFETHFETYFIIQNQSLFDESNPGDKWEKRQDTNQSRRCIWHKNPDAINSKALPFNRARKVVANSAGRTEKWREPPSICHSPSQRVNEPGEFLQGGAYAHLRATMLSRDRKHAPPCVRIRELHASWCTWMCACTCARVRMCARVVARRRTKRRMEWNDGGRLPGVATPAIEPYAALSSALSNRDGRRESRVEHDWMCTTRKTTPTHTHTRVHITAQNISMLVMMINEPDHNGFLRYLRLHLTREMPRCFRVKMGFEYDWWWWCQVQCERWWASMGLVSFRLAIILTLSLSLSHTHAHFSRFSFFFG